MQKGELKNMSNKNENEDLGLNASSTIEKSVNLDTPGVLAALSRRIAEDIDAYCIKAYDDGHRNHLGASIIGQACARASWYTFRWVYYKRHTGRMLRLFQRGHLEEARFIEYLRGIGFEVFDVAIDGEQHRIKGVFGHFGGSLDGGAKFPELYQINEPILTEFKTQGTGSKFVKMKEKGVRLTKPQHYAQMCVYGNKYKLKYALYMVVNKNDDDLHIEVVRLDWAFGAELEQKAERIINAIEPPEKLGMVPTYYECKYCDFLEVCHNGAPSEKNCRSCKNCFPADNAEWNCSKYGIVPKDFIKTGCGEWVSII